MLSRCLALSVFSVSTFAQYSVRFPPTYSAESIVNGASFKPGPVCPNAIVSIFGQYLASQPHAISTGDVNAGTLPSSMLLEGVKVMVEYTPAPLYFVSPGQINFLMPPESVRGHANVYVTWQG